MGMKCKYDHYEKAVGGLGGNQFHIDLKLVTDDDNIYQRVVVAISNALGYPMVTREEKPVLGFHADVLDQDDGSEMGDDA